MKIECFGLKVDPCELVLQVRHGEQWMDYASIKDASDAFHAAQIMTNGVAGSSIQQQIAATRFRVVRGGYDQVVAVGRE